MAKKDNQNKADTPTDSIVLDLEEEIILKNKANKDYDAENPLFVQNVKKLYKREEYLDYAQKLCRSVNGLTIVDGLPVSILQSAKTNYSTLEFPELDDRVQYSFFGVINLNVITNLGANVKINETICRPFIALLVVPPIYKEFCEKSMREEENLIFYKRYKYNYDENFMKLIEFCKKQNIYLIAEMTMSRILDQIRDLGANDSMRGGKVIIA
jgi:histidinol phosphatase-like PHP family hydrolase